MITKKKTNSEIHVWFWSQERKGKIDYLSKKTEFLPFHHLGKAKNEIAQIGGKHLATFLLRFKT